MQNNRYVQIDILKLFFCIGVILYHYCMLFFNNNASLLPFNHFRWIFRWGSLGVDFFYLSSGFFIHNIYRNSIERMNFKDFIFKRIRSIYPMYLTVILLLISLFFIDYIFFDNEIYHAKINCWHLIKSVLCISGGWFDGDVSPYGMGMYFVNILFLNYIVYFLLTKKTKNSIIAYILWAIIGFVCATTAKNIPFFYSRTGRGYMSFAIGIILCEFSNYGRIEEKQKNTFCFYLTFVLTVLMICIVRFGIEPTLGHVWKSVSVFIFPSVFFVLINTSFVFQFFNWLSSRFIQINNIGHYSSSLYFSASVSMVAIRIIARLQGIENFHSKNWFLETMAFVFVFSILWDFVFRKIHNKQKSN